MKDKHLKIKAKLAKQLAKESKKADQGGEAQLVEDESENLAELEAEYFKMKK